MTIPTEETGPLTTYGYPLWTKTTREFLSSSFPQDMGPESCTLEVWDPFGIRGTAQSHYFRHALKNDTSQRRREGEAKWMEAHDMTSGIPVFSKSNPTLVGGPAILADWTEAWEMGEAFKEEEAVKDALDAWEKRRDFRRKQMVSSGVARGLPMLHCRAWIRGRGEWAPETQYLTGDRVMTAVGPLLAIQAGKSGLTSPAPGKDGKAEDGGVTWQILAAQVAASDTISQIRKEPEERTNTMLVLVGDAGTGKTGSAVVAYLDFLVQHSDQKDPRPDAAKMKAEREMDRERGFRTFPEGGEDHGGSKSGDFLCDRPSIVLWGAATRARSNIFGKDASEEISRAINADVLLIDDVGAELVTDNGSWLSVLGEVINARYEDGAITIMTANMAPETLKTRLGDRIVDRIREVGRVVQCGSTSVRRALNVRGAL